MSRRFLLMTLTAVLATGLVLGFGLLTPGAVSQQGPQYPAGVREAPLRPAPPHEVLVRFRAGADAEDRAAVRRRADTELKRTLPVRGLQLVDPEPGVSVREAVADLERSAEVLYAEPDVARSAKAVPNDRLFGYLWGLHNTGQEVAGTAGTVDADIDAPEAWDLTTGTAGVTVGIVDSGVDEGHPDLAPNRWSNPGETGGDREANGVDDDGNGLVDDARGWDWVAADNAPTDENGHGTHVAGTVGARGNDGAGVAGIAWNVSLLPLRVLNGQGSGRVSDAISAYGYAARKNIRIVNASLGGDTFSRSERDAIAAASSTLFVVAAGNGGADNDAKSFYPCSHPLENVVCVAASDQHDGLAPFSSYGSASVDLAAPGVAVASTWLEGDWALLDGTSMAAPHVAGAAALVWSRAPSASVVDVRRALLGSVDPKASLVGRTATGGRLNVHRAVAAVTGTESSQSAPAVREPAPTPAPAPGAAPDTAAPGVSISAASSQRLRTALRAGVRARTRCSEACAIRHELVLDRRTVRRLRLGSGRRPLVVGTGRGGVAAAGSTTIAVRLTSRAKRRFARLRTVTLELRTRAVDAAGNRTTLKRRIRLRR